jgi:hypothetical protein
VPKKLKPRSETLRGTEAGIGINADGTGLNIVTEDTPRWQPRVVPESELEAELAKLKLDRVLKRAAEKNSTED